MKAAASGLTQHEAKNAWTKGKKVGSSQFRLSFVSAKTPHSRWQIQISKKLTPFATERNRLRRMIRESLRQLEEELTQPVFGIISLTEVLPRAKTPDVKTLLIPLLQQARLLKTNK